MQSRHCVAHAEHAESCWCFPFQTLPFHNVEVHRPSFQKVPVSHLFYVRQTCTWLIFWRSSTLFLGGTGKQTGTVSRRDSFLGGLQEHCCAFLLVHPKRDTTKEFEAHAGLAKVLAARSPASARARSRWYPNSQKTPSLKAAPFHPQSLFGQTPQNFQHQ